MQISAFPLSVSLSYNLTCLSQQEYEVWEAAYMPWSGLCSFHNWDVLVKDCFPFTLESFNSDFNREKAMKADSKWENSRMRKEEK
jgi:hypothetical protein